MLQRIWLRVVKSITTVPDRSSWLWALGLLLLYGLIYLPIGFSTGFLTLQVERSIWTTIGVLARAFIMPGITKELFFRAILIPHRSEAVRPGNYPDREIWIWSGISLISFILYHPLNPFAPTFFSDPIFLLGAGLLGIACTLSYWQSGSLWTAVVIHWLAVAVWLLVFGGLSRF
ncbi:CPBP family glutamic-type intramembrane protease [Leptolyngbya ohadii]|uniref:CPBP family glutamic-type intramembrane protease n=1 Tax=Leptolyngbya ohadii TaxID=1962290 RepID=UPI0015C65A11|nr:CPBP family glutamic-type intramembrane protease [Leptolyngbya ohadii]